jgi:hypothetical protein
VGWPGGFGLLACMFASDHFTGHSFLSFTTSQTLMEPLQANYQPNSAADSVEIRPLLPLNRFVILSVATLGLYGVWWIYKSWKFFKEREGLDIYPAVRTIFSLFFLHELLEKIKRFSKQTGHEPNYSSATLTIGYFMGNLLSRMDRYFLVAALGLALTLLTQVQPFKALNWAIENSPDYRAEESTSFSGRQLGLLIVGGLFWALILLGMTME